MALADGVTADGMEYSIHACPPRISKEVATVLPGADLTKLLIVPTCQRAATDLVKTGDDVEKEKDELLEKFMAWAKKVCATLEEKGFWVDYIDPCSGLAMVHQDSQIVYSEVEALSALKGYATANAGCCKVLLHPKWGSSVYPATMFACAPLEDLKEAITAAG